MFDTVTQGKVIVNKNEKTVKFKEAQKNTHKKKTGLLMNAMTGGTAGLVNGAMQSANKGPYSFKEIIGYELLEDDSSVASGGLGRALVGGIALGGIGAVVGAVTGKKTAKKIVNNLVIRVDINNMDNPCIIIPFISKKTKTKSGKYKSAYSSAQKTISALNMVVNQAQLLDKLEDDTEDYNEDDFIDDVEGVDDDPIEEVKKMKELLDLGIINQDEFDQKKKELLNL